MDNKELKNLWSQMLGKKKPSKEVISILEAKMLEDIVFETPFIDEFHDSILIKYQGTIIAGLLPKTQYKTLTPWGNFEKFLRPNFWASLAEKLVLSYESKEKSGSNKLKTSSVEIVKQFSKVHNEEKSNRSGGDLSELLTIKSLCSKYSIPFNYESDLSSVLEKINSMETGKEKIFKEEKNVALLTQGCVEIISKKPEVVTDIEWMGRSSDGTEDLLIKTVSRFIYVSLKSISKNGKGTAKNLGAASLLHLELDISEMSNNMKNAVIEAAALQYSSLGITTDSKLSDIKDLSRENEELKKLAESVSAPFLSLINTSVYNAFNSLPQLKKHDFTTTHILDQKDNKELWVVVANDQGMSYWNQNEYALLETDVLSVGDLTPKGFKILKNGKNFIRVNTCCTNGKGLSAPCLRIFLD